MSRPAADSAAPLRVPLTIGFRLDDESRRVLGERAARLRVSVHDLARTYVREALHVREERAILVQTLRSIDDRLLRLHGDVATTAEAMLVNAGKVQAEEAHHWVEENFK
jgi:hypothetical protein